MTMVSFGWCGSRFEPEVRQSTYVLHFSAVIE